jgi:hypothetical protein
VFAYFIIFLSRTGLISDLKANWNHYVLRLPYFVAGQVEIMDLNDKISEITQKIASLKCEVMSVMEESYVKFNVLHKETAELDSRVKALSNEMNHLLIRVENQVCR